MWTVVQHRAGCAGGLQSASRPPLQARTGHVRSHPESLAVSLAASRRRLVKVPPEQKKILGLSPTLAQWLPVLGGPSSPAVTHPGETENHPAVLTAYRAGDINSCRKLTRLPRPLLVLYAMRADGPVYSAAAARGLGLGITPSPCGTRSRCSCYLHKRGVRAELYPSSALQLLSKNLKQEEPSRTL